MIDQRIQRMKKNRVRYKYILGGMLVLLTGIWMIWGNFTVGMTVIEISDENLPASFDGFKIAQVSDLHNAEFGQNHSKLIGILEAGRPDMIALTGDLVDSDRTDLDSVAAFIKQAVEIAPCYFVTGNHEAWIGAASYGELENLLCACGVMVLHNQTVCLENGGASIQITGIGDPEVKGAGNGVFASSDEFLIKEIEEAGSSNGYSILLSHRPESFNAYCEKNINLVLSGHAHGGQFRLPLIGGIVAPGQGLFPRYDSGVYKSGDTTMIVSRGIGNSVIPVRVNNRPEVVSIILHP